MAYLPARLFRSHSVSIFYYKFLIPRFTAFSILLLFAASTQLISQSSDVVYKTDLSKKNQKRFDESVKLLRLGYIESGMELMDRILSKEPDCIDCLVQKSSAYFNAKEYWNAIPPLERIIQLDPEYRSMVWVIYGQSLFFMERYGESIEALDHYLQAGHKEGKWTREARDLKRHALFARDAVRDTADLRLFQLTGPISTPQMEYHPSITADGRVMVFTRKNGGQEDLMVSTWQDSIWSEGLPLESVNTRGNEGAHCISADGRTIVFTSCHKQEGMGSCDLYISEWKEDYWTLPENMGPTVNSTAWESMPSLSANGEWLYFSSNRRGGHGGTDIWITRRSVDGGWVTPFNAGPVINTTENEESPFIHQDGKSLYFMSEGHPGFGGQDIFFSQKNEKNKWSVPVNLGYPINTSSQEGGINVTIDGGIAYMFTDRVGPDRTDPRATDDFDIISLELPKELRPQPTTYLRLLVKDGQNREPVQAKVEVHTLPSDQLYYRGITGKNGEYLVCLPAGNEFLFNINAPGYVMHSDQIALVEENSVLSPMEKEVFLFPITPESADDTTRSRSFTLENIFFATGSDSLMESSNFEIERLASFLRSNPELRIEIRGHTDNVGSENDNMELSTARARAVYQALLNRGITAQRMDYKGFGETRPIADNSTEQGRARNRRTEFIILRR